MLQKNEIEHTLNMLMKSMVRAFNLQGRLKPLVAVLKRDHGGALRLDVLQNGMEFFANGERGREALLEFSNDTLGQDDVEGIVLCHEATVTTVERKHADGLLGGVDSCAPASAFDCVMAGVHLRAGDVYTHLLMVNPDSRKVDFKPYVCPPHPDMWSELSANATPDNPQTYH